MAEALQAWPLSSGREHPKGRVGEQTVQQNVAEAGHPASCPLHARHGCRPEFKARRIRSCLLLGRSKVTALKGIWDGDVLVVIKDALCPKQPSFWTDLQAGTRMSEGWPAASPADVEPTDSQTETPL